MGNRFVLLLLLSLIWSFSAFADTQVYLSPEEKAYLSSKKVVTYCIDPYWEPFEYFDANGDHQGLTRDYLDLIKRRIAIRTRLVKTTSWSETMSFLRARKCDMILELGPTPSRKKYMLFTEPYLDFPQVVATRKDSPFVDSMGDLRRKKVAMIAGYAIIEIVRSSYPDFQPVLVKSAMEGVKKVADGEVDAFIDFLPSVSRAINLLHTGNLKIAGRIDEKVPLAIASRSDEPLLRSIMQKAIDTFTYEDHHAILDKWMTVEFDVRVNYTLVWKVVVTCLTILLLFIYWNRTISRARRELEAKNVELISAYDKIEEKNMELKTLSITDFLTGLYNRTQIDQSLLSEFARYRRYGQTFSVLLMDIDHFKHVNDTYGHMIGDEVLKLVASLFKEAFRKTDLLGRWGGEEFIAVFPETDLATATPLAESLRQAIARHTFPQVGQVTVSIGVAECSQDDSIDSLLERADKRLYAAKKGGRNRVVAL